MSHSVCRGFRTAYRLLLVVDAVVQAGGLVLFTYGATSSRQDVVRDKTTAAATFRLAHVTASPWSTANGAGVSVTGLFF